MKNILRRFRNDRSGTAAVIFAVALAPILLGIGMAVDYGTVYSSRLKVANAADAAALAAVKAASDYVSTNPTAGDRAWQREAEKVGTTFFQTNLANIAGVTADTPTFAMDRTATSISVTVNYKGASKTYFGHLAGFDSAGIAGSATASNALPGYVQINFLVDISQSMGIGATATDQQTLMDATTCTIACHYQDIYGTPFTYPGARASGATLRIDVARNAILKVLDRIQAQRANSQQYQVAVYTFSNSLATLFAPSTNIALAKLAAAKLEISSDLYQGGTNTRYAIEQFAQTASESGDGSSTSKRRIFTVLITDGVENSTQYYTAPVQGPPYVAARFDPNFVMKAPYDVNNSFETIQGFNASACGALKTKKQNIMTLDVDYLVPSISPDADQPRYQYIEKELKPHILENMTRCASNPDFVYNAASPAEIEKAALDILDEIEKEHLRLVN